MDADARKPALVVLAGGKGSRAGTPKGLIRIGNHLWLEEQLERVPRGEVGRVIVVLGHESQRYFDAIPSLRSTGGVVNPRPELGPFSSLLTGLEYVDLEWVSGVFVLPVDVPAPNAEIWRTLARALESGADAAIPTEGEKGGHPVLLSPKFARRLSKLDPRDPDSRLDRQLAFLTDELRVRVPVQDPCVRMNFNTPEDWRRETLTDLAGRQAALLSGVEIGVGSFLHAFKIPLAGQLLSLNECFMLSQLARKSSGRSGARTLPAVVASVSAVLKSLSPAGKKLEPMLAIAAQGTLFTAGTALLGCNLAGALLGSVLASAWAFVQPLAIYYLLFGHALIEALDRVYRRAQEVYPFRREDLLIAIAVLIALKAVLAAAVSALAFKLPESRVSRYQRRMLEWGRARSGSSQSTREPQRGTMARARAAVGDLMRPLFLLSLVLTTAFALYADASTSFSEKAWALLRPLAFGFILFFTVRSMSFVRLAERMRGSRRFSRFGGALSAAVHALQRIEP